MYIREYILYSMRVDCVLVQTCVGVGVCVRACDNYIVLGFRCVYSQELLFL